VTPAEFEEIARPLGELEDYLAELMGLMSDKWPDQ